METERVMEEKETTLTDDIRGHIEKFQLDTPLDVDLHLKWHWKIEI